MAGSGLTQVLSTMIYKIMKPLAAVLMRHNVPFQVFSNIAKRAFVEAAAQNTAIPGKKLSLSRISILTGIPRKEIKNIMDMEMVGDKDITKEHNRAARVITGWMSNETFTDPKTQKPLDLAIDGDEPNFSSLVQKFSGGIPVKALLDELLRIDAVSYLEKEKKYRLVAAGYIPNNSEIEQINNVGQEIADLINVIHHNLSHEPKERFLQLSVRCDNLPEEVMEKLRYQCGEKGQQSLTEMAANISNYDRNQNDNIFGTGQKRIAVGFYYYDEDVNSEANEQTEKDDQSK